MKAGTTEHKDLFRALKGGESNFGIVTKFRLETFESQGLDAAIVGYQWRDLSQVIRALADFNNLASCDPAAAVTLSVGIDSTTQQPNIVALLTHPDKILNSRPLKPFLAIVSQPYARRRVSLVELSEQLDLSNPPGFRYACVRNLEFHELIPSVCRQHKSTLTISNDAELANIIVATFAKRILSSNLTDDPTARAGILIQPLTLPHLRAGLRSGNNSLGLHDENDPLLRKPPFFLYLLMHESKQAFPAQ